MPEHLRALAVILGLAIPVFAFAKAPACAVACNVHDFRRRRNLWFAVTLTAFLAHNFWIYIVITAAALLFVLPRESNKLAMYFSLLFAVPPISDQIPGFGLMNFIFDIDYVRLLALTVLVPAYFHLRGQPQGERFGRLLPDKLVFGYLALLFLLQLSVDSVTNALRHGVFYAFTDVFLPYYVASRALKDLRGFRDALMALAVAGMLLAAVGAFEFAKHWLLYRTLEASLGVRLGGSYLLRGGLLRAQATTGQPIPLGYVMAVAIGFFLYLKRAVPNPAVWGIGMALLVVGLIAPVSRGPWLGCAAILLLFVATDRAVGVRVVQLALVAAVVLPILMMFPIGDKLIDYLPFVGRIEEGNITYRQRVLAVSIEQIMQHPYFGSFDALLTQEMQDLKQGQGIVDIVNTYLEVGLKSGLIGLTLFSGFFGSVVVAVFRGMRSLRDRASETYLLGQVLLATLLGILLMIFTVSSISIIPVVYWSVAGLGVAYARMSRFAQATESARSPQGAAAPVNV